MGFMSIYRLESQFQLFENIFKSQGHIGQQ